MASPASNPSVLRRFLPWSLCSGAFGCIVAGDLLLPATLLMPVAYLVPLVFCGRSQSLRLLWFMAGLAALGTVIGYFFQTPIIPLPNPVIAVLNRLLLVVVLLVVTVYIHLRIVGEATLREHESRLIGQADQLSLINEEIRRREEEIVRQNEELQSQTEELERQTEELRVTNEELAAREKSLERLLELSRSLTAELTRSQLMDKICEALGQFTDGQAASIIERREAGMEVVCHHGFGPGGLVSSLLPANDSFASVILSMGQTGFIEDIRTRPELIVPEPVEGEGFLSVLSTPLRVQGRPHGTVEVYSHNPRTWDFAQVALIESLAAQAAISLQNMNLIENIRQERRRFETAFRTVPFGLAVTDDPAGRDVRLNPAAAAILGVPVGENVSSETPIGMRLRRQFKRNRLPVEPDDFPLSRALRGEEVPIDELEFATTKQTVTLLCCAAPILDGQGRTVGAVTAFVDITQIKNLQRELDLRRREAEEASIRKTRFLAAVSHDIRTPANAINLMAELIRRAGDNPELQKDLPDLAARLQSNTISLMELVTDVLDVARFDSGKVELIESEFALADLMTDECRHVRPLAEDKGLSLICEPPERPIWLHTDRVKLGRILGNLLGNAIKFTHRGEIRLSAKLLSSQERRLEICVSDTGIGIAQDNLQRIFDEFAQLHNPERDRTKGTGLGLAICKRLMDVIGGEITVTSMAGKGSTFHVVLPASCVAMRLDATMPMHAIESKTNHAPGAASSRLAGLQILLVEDHAATRDGTARLLRHEGAVVREVATGREALDIFSQCRGSVVLLDMMLPDMDGREILRALQEKPEAGVRGVLVLTGDLTNDRVADVKNLGADGLIGKPIDLQKLIAALQNYLAGD